MAVNNTLSITITATRINVLYNDLGQTMGVFAASWNKNDVNFSLSFDKQILTVRVRDDGEHQFSADGAEGTIAVGSINAQTPNDTEDLYNKIIAAF